MKVSVTPIEASQLIEEKFEEASGRPVLVHRDDGHPSTMPALGIYGQSAQLASVRPVTLQCDSSNRRYSGATSAGPR